MAATGTGGGPDGDGARAPSPSPSPVPWLRGVVAHRGTPRLHRDNTVAGIGAAVRLGAAAVEADVRLTADGVPVLHHDPALPWRPGRPRTPVATLGFDALRRRAEHVPTLTQALAAARGSGVPLVLDIGTIETARACLEALTASPAARSQDAACPTWFCGAPGALAWIRSQQPHRPLLLSWERREPPPATLVDDVRPTMFNPRHRVVTPALVEHWHGRGVGVCTWTVDCSWRRARMLRWGVDAVISNDVVGAVRDARRAGLRRPGPPGTMCA